MKLFISYVMCWLVPIVLVSGFLWSFHCEAQVPNRYYYNFYSISPLHYNFNSLSHVNPYAGWGITNPYISLLAYTNPLPSALPGPGTSPGSGYFGNGPLNQSSLQGFSLMELVSSYNYLNYAAQFYQIAREIPLFYLRDIQADQIGALLFSYADTQGVSLQDAMYYFLQQMYIQ